MAIIKCKMCGGDLILEEGSNVAECEYCGSRQTVPTADNEKKMNLFARANRLRANNEFDKASGVYESIVADFPEEAEAYWGLILCKYGIEYVDDPATGKKIPTCHRSSFDIVMDDPNFELVMENADPIARRVYREEAKQLEELRKGIIEVSSKEEPYDIFICYKETAEDGQRTLDSVLAQDVYDMLTENGYRVFFSRVTLEDKLGVEYEPYIFAALNSAKIMLAFGTDYDYYNAVWVKNEWSRFLQLIAKGEKKTLIPCYKNIDAYDMPKEFAKLQAQDLGKVGAMQDLLRGIKKILPGNRTVQKEQPALQPVVQQVGQTGGPSVPVLLKRGYMSLEDGQWGKAKELFDQVLNLDVENAEAYLGTVMANEYLSSIDSFQSAFVESKIKTDFNLQRARQFANEEKKAWFRVLDAEREKVIKQKKEEEEIAKRELANKLTLVRAKSEPMRNLIVSGGESTFGLCADGTVFAAGDRVWHNFEEIKKWKGIVSISCEGVLLGVHADGTVKTDVSRKEYRDLISKLSNVVEVHFTEKGKVCLRSDGTVFIASEKPTGRSAVEKWHDIISVVCGRDYIIGLQANGSVIADGKFNSAPYDVTAWKDIKKIVKADSMGDRIFGITKKGTVLAVGDNHFGQCSVSAWTNIVEVSSGSFQTIGLRDDGGVVSTGTNAFGECNVSSWKNIVAIAAGNGYSLGLRADGRVLATGNNENGQCDVYGWSNIVAIYAFPLYTVGLKSDGTVVSTKLRNSKDVLVDDKGQCNLSGWRLFQNYETFEQERKEAAERAKRASKEAAERAEKERIAAEQRRREENEHRCQELSEKIASAKQRQVVARTALANLRGLFTSKRRKELEAELASLEHQIAELQKQLDAIK